MLCPTAAGPAPLEDPAVGDADIRPSTSAVKGNALGAGDIGEPYLSGPPDQAWAQQVVWRRRLRRDGGGGGGGGEEDEDEEGLEWAME